MQIWALRLRLEKQPTDLWRRHHYMRDGAPGGQARGNLMKLGASESELPLAYPFRGGKDYPFVLFRLAGSAYRLDEMKEAREKIHKLSRLLEAALDTALVLVIGYALILLSQSQPFF